MKYYSYHENDVTFVKINLLQATKLESKEITDILTRLIEKENCKKIVIDFETVDYIDSSFLGGIVTALKIMTKYNGDIKVVNLKPTVKALFEITRLYKVFEIFEKREDALLSF